MAKRKKKASRKRNVSKKKRKAKKSTKKAPLKAVETDIDELEDEIEEEEEENEGEATLFSTQDDEEDDLDEDDSLESDDEADDDEEEALDEGQAVLASDIFTDVGEKFQKKGVHVYYTIYRNNQLLPPAQHPCSYEWLHKSHGGGLYRVVAKNSETHRYIKSETKALAPLPGDSLSVSQTRSRTEQSEPEEAPRQQTGPQNLSMLDFLSLMQQERSGAKAELRELTQSQGSSQNTMLTMMLQMMQNQQSQSTQMMTQLQQSQMEMFKEMRASQDKMYMQMQNQMEKITEKTKANKEYSPFELMAKVKEASTKELEHFRKIQAEVEDRVERDAELRAEIEKIRQEANGKKSATDKIIELMIPVIAASAQKGAMPAQALPRPNSAPRPLPPIDTPQRNIHSKPLSPIPQAETPLRGRSQNGITRGRSQPVHQRTSKPVPANGKAQKEIIIDPAPIKEGAIMTTDKRNTVVELLTGHVGKSLASRKRADVAAKEAIDILLTNQISSEEAISLLSEAQLIAIARSYKIPTIADPWLKDFYGHIQRSGKTPESHL